MILAAVEKDIIRKNPCTGVSIKKDYGQLKKGHTQSGRNNQTCCHAL